MAAYKQQTNSFLFMLLTGCISEGLAGLYFTFYFFGIILRQSQIPVTSCIALFIVLTGVGGNLAEL